MVDDVVANYHKLDTLFLPMISESTHAMYVIMMA